MAVGDERVSPSGPLGGEPAVLSVRELRAELRWLGVDASGCLEKSDLVARLAEARASRGAAAAAPGARAGASQASQPAAQQHQQRQQQLPAISSLPATVIKDLLARHGADSGAAGTLEQQELIGALRERLRRCPVCLDDVDPDDVSPSQRCCDGCRAVFHRSCAAGHMLAAAEAARLPLLCPIPGCQHRWRGDLVAWALDEAELQRYNAAVRGVRELRERAAGESSGSASAPAAGAGPHGGGTGDMSPRTASALRQLGVRMCPRCGTPIEKQGAGYGHGCDKMTCRCGCMFCYACGAEAGPGGLARCQCVSDRHSYLPHSSVLHNYRDMMDGSIPFAAGFFPGGPFSAGGPQPFAFPAGAGAPFFAPPPAFGARPPHGASAAGAGWPPEVQNLFGAGGVAGGGPNFANFVQQGGLGGLVQQAMQAAGAAMSANSHAARAQRDGA